MADGTYHPDEVKQAADFKRQETVSDAYDAEARAFAQSVREDAEWKALREATALALRQRFNEKAVNEIVARRKMDAEVQSALLIMDMMKADCADDLLTIAPQIARLIEDHHRAQIAAVMLRSLPESMVYAVFEAFEHDEGLGRWLNAEPHRDNAKFWAKDASQSQLKAFIFEGLNHLRPETREAMRVWLNKEAGK